MTDAESRFAGETERLVAETEDNRLALARVREDITTADQGGDRRGEERARGARGRAAARAPRGRRPAPQQGAGADRADRPRAHRVAGDAGRDLLRRRTAAGRADRRSVGRETFPARRGGGGRVRFDHPHRAEKKQAASWHGSSTARSKVSCVRPTACSPNGWPSSTTPRAAGSSGGTRERSRRSSGGWPTRSVTT